MMTSTNELLETVRIDNFSTAVVEVPDPKGKLHPEPLSYIFPLNDIVLEDGNKIQVYLDINSNVTYSDQVAVSLHFSTSEVTKVFSELKLKVDFSIINCSGNKTQTNLMRKTIKNVDSCNLVVENKRYIRKSHLFDPTTGFLVKDRLQLSCKVEVLKATFKDDKNRLSIDDASQDKKEFGVECKTSTNSLLSETQKVNFKLTSADENDIALITVGRKQFRVNKTLLASNSEYFSKIFANNISMFYKIENIEHELFSAMLHFIEHEDFEAIEKGGSILEMFIVSSKYKMRKLLVKCEDWLCSNLTDENAITILQHGEKYGSERVKLAAMAYIKSKPKLRDTENFKALTIEDPALFDELDRNRKLVTRL